MNQTQPGCLSPDEVMGFVDGWLSLAARTNADAHLARCAVCSLHVSELVKSSRMTGTVPLRALDDSIPSGSLVGRYVLRVRIGSGAMGVVYEAYDPQLDRRVALKMVRPYSGQDLSPGRLEREARVMAKISHPNVVAVHDVAIHDGQLVIAMEFVDGETLRSWLEHEPRPAEQILERFREAGRGLAAAHATGIVHRDFKPENVLCDRLGRVRVTDFGLALARSAAPEMGLQRASRGHLASRSTHSIAGTPAYMAPEQHAGRAADARSDQFSFCVALYEALYGSHPFGKEGALAPKPPAKNVSRRVQRAVLRGLRVDPSERHASIDTLLVELAPARSKKWLAAFAIAVLALAVAVPLQHRRAKANAVGTCESNGTRLAEAWNEERRETMHRAFVATGKRWAEDAWSIVGKRLDVYAVNLRGAQVAACRAASPGNSTPLLDLQLSCIDDQKKEFAVLVDVLSRADADLVTKSVAAVDALPNIAACNDTKRLLLRPDPPPEPERASQVARVRGELARIRALDDAGQYAEAGRVAEATLQSAESLAYAPLLAEALFLRGHLQAQLGKPKDADVTLERAVAVADSVGDDRTRAHALIKMLFNVNAATPDSLSRLGFLNALAGAALERTGGDRDLEATRHLFYGDALRKQRRADQALPELETAGRLYEALGDRQGRVHVWNAMGYAHVMRRDLVAAEATYRRAIAGAEMEFGAHHPIIATTLNGLGDVLGYQARFSEAFDLYERATRIAEEAWGPDTRILIAFLGNSGAALYRMGRHRDALAALERGRALQVKMMPDSPMGWQFLALLGDVHLALGDRGRALSSFEQALDGRTEKDNVSALAPARFGLARALWSEPKQRARAKALALQARDALQAAPKMPADALVIAQIESWLAEHPKP